MLLTSIAFAVSATRLARQKVLTQELAAIEGLARVDVICLDKTGTLTEGDLVLGNVEHLDEAHAGDTAPALAAMAAADDHPNPSLLAIRNEYDRPPGWTLTETVPFSSARKWSAAAWADHGAWLLGAPDILLTHAADPDAGRRRHRAHAALRRAGPAGADAGPGAGRPAPARSCRPTSCRWRWSCSTRSCAGRSPRRSPTSAARACSSRSSRATTRPRSARSPTRCGVPDADRTYDARELPEDQEAMADVLEQHAVFGRVTPHQKRAMVHALQSRGHEVAMTGDGVNDTLALKDADIGVAMGSGSAAARAVARFVLLDNDFAVFPSVVSEGRRVIANVERVANLFLTKTFYACSWPSSSAWSACRSRSSRGTSRSSARSPSASPASSWPWPPTSGGPSPGFLPPGAALRHPGRAGRRHRHHDRLPGGPPPRRAHPRPAAHGGGDRAVHRGPVGAGHPGPADERLAPRRWCCPWAARSSACSLIPPLRRLLRPAHPDRLDDPGRHRHRRPRRRPARARLAPVRLEPHPRRPPHDDPRRSATLDRPRIRRRPRSRTVGTTASRGTYARRWLRAEPAMPTSIEPMRATTGETPTDDTGWAYEIKWDGMRAIAFCDRGALRLASSNGIDATVRFPELAPLADVAGRQPGDPRRRDHHLRPRRPARLRPAAAPHARQQRGGRGRGGGRPARGLRRVRHAVARRPRRHARALPRPQAAARPARRAGPDLDGARARDRVRGRAARRGRRPGARGAHRQAHRQHLRDRPAVERRGAS